MLLVVEDNPQFSLALSRMLDRLGEKYEVVDTGEEAVHRVLSEGGEHYRLILLDMTLPGISGIDTARAIRAIDDPQKAEIPILVMSALAPTIEEMGELHFAGILAKSFFGEDLRNAIERHARPSHLSAA